MSGIVTLAKIAAFTGLAPPTLRESPAFRGARSHLAPRCILLSRPPSRGNRPPTVHKIRLSSAAGELSSFIQDSANHSIPIARASCSGLVQSIFSSPPRRSTVADSLEMFRAATLG